MAMVRGGRLLLAGPVAELRRGAQPPRRGALRRAGRPVALRRGGRRRGGGGRPAPPLRPRRRAGAACSPPSPPLPVDDVAIERAEPRGGLPRPLRRTRPPREHDLRPRPGARPRADRAARASASGCSSWSSGLSYASVDQNAIRQVVDALPPALRALAGSADIATPTGYAGSGYLHPVALAVQAAVAISMAAAPGPRGGGRHRRARPLAAPAPARAGSAAHALAMVTGLVVVVVGGYLGGALAAADGRRPRARSTSARWPSRSWTGSSASSPWAA